ncbi:hypothetical protein CHS0354_015033 [Potamilus streckersoni]|uniref:VWFD domain-containing protein n=1 Tax=Potamilus streckersoni TaxID=2493646 RepID=A0AAE0TG87_9BIVA|nr:hypothetical protein CHS0354_015033 [Potamilus streckersoni]
MRTNPCYGFREGPPFCPCGVAIAAGRDVFVVDRCSIPITIYMPQCDDGTLKGKIKSDDRSATRGLCGSLDNDIQNDFVLRNGTNIPYNKFEDFNSNWQVRPEEDLFNSSNYNTLLRWPHANYLCICGQYQDGHSFQSDNCSADSRKFCPESALNDSLASDCTRKQSTNANVSMQLDPSDFNISRSENDTKTEIQTRKNYTEDSANYACWTYLNSSLLFEKCAKLPDIDSKSFAATCAKDALITKTMFWAPTHLDNAQKRCIYQVTVNQPLPEHIIEQLNVTSNYDEQASNKTTNAVDEYTSNLLQELKDLACPMNCTDQGDCIKGQCHCYKRYGGNDCSVDLNKAPDVYGIPNRGVCELQQTSCNSASVLGDDFVDSKNLSCRLSLFQVKANETIFNDNIIVLNGKWISFAEVSCPIVDVRSKRSVQFSDDFDTLAIGYKVAVGNTREIFGRDISLLVVDSLCVDCVKAGFNITCTLKDGFDLVNRRCNKKISPEQKVESGSIVVIISSVVGSVLVVIVVGMVLHYCLVVRIRRAKYETENRDKSYLELQEMEKRKDYYGIVEEVYDEIKASPDDYSTIRDIVPTNDESKDRDTSYIKLSNVQKNEFEGYSYLSKLATTESDPNGSKHEKNEQGAPAGETKLRYQKRPLPAKVHEDLQL